jgi:glycosyltransferase involved in cell wall biosynthesis
MTAAGRLRVGIDATPLLGQRSGVGRYVEGLLGGLRQLGPEDAVLPVLTTFSLRGTLPPEVAADGAVRASARRVPARLLQAVWGRVELPPVEWLSGRVEVFHATNFVLPPTRRAAGVVSIHDMAFERYRDTVSPGALRYREAVPRSVGRADRVICFVESVAEEIRERYRIEPERVVVIPHGVDPSWGEAQPLDAAALLGAGLPERYLLVVGSLEPRKNLSLIVAAHRLARQRDRQSVPPLVLVGGAGWGDRWNGAPPDPDHVVLAGFLDDTLLRGVVASALAVCMPSRYEGFGLPVLEALAAGRPVLASDIDAHRAVAGEAAELLSIDGPDDVEGWAEALIAVSRADPAGAGASDRRRAHASAFTWERSARAHVEVYRTVR